MTSRSSAVRVAILHVPGTNRDREAALACELAGGQAEIVVATGQPEDQIAAAQLARADLVVLPGGFSFGDDLGAGRLLASALTPGRSRLGDALVQVVESGRFVLGICNGFQALLKSGLLPGAASVPAQRQRATLARNASGHFECRWVYLRPEPGTRSELVRALGESLVHCPVAHGEGRFVCDEATLAQLEAQGLVALRYCTAQGEVPHDAGYPTDPNGSLGHIAGICNAAGNVLGLMPHPEDHIDALQSPLRAQAASAAERAAVPGLRLFEAAVALTRARA